LGKKNLAAVSCGADAGGSVDIYADIAHLGPNGLSCVESHPNPDLCSFRPGVVSYGMLGRNSRYQAISGTREGDEEGIPLSVNLISAPLLEG
jgi:hypothetical protein